jgi:hypothetical protein
VEAWLDSIDPSVIDRWLAYDRIEPISTPWHHTAEVCRQIWEALQYWAAKQGIELPARAADHWIPDRSGAASAAPPTPSYTTDLAAAEAALARRYG